MQTISITIDSVATMGRCKRLARYRLGSLRRSRAVGTSAADIQEAEREERESSDSRITESPAPTGAVLALTESTPVDLPQDGGNQRELDNRRPSRKRRRRRASMRLARSAGVSREDEVRYRVDPHIWDLPQFANIPYSNLKEDFLAWLANRTERRGPATAATIKAYRDTLTSFGKSLEVEGEPLTAASVSAKNYDS